MKFVFSKEVKHALDNKLPIIALESTIVTHGMPYPTNVETTRLVENEMRKNGVTPATIAFINGEVHVGLTDEELDYIGKTTGTVKISRRDIPVVVAKKLSGGTTVATTMIIADMVGIRLFVTGGIGGCHKGANINFDISADLDELSKTNVAVICAGPKAILDIPLTLEYLETKGVPVLGYKTDRLPLFYSSTSDYDVDYRVDDPKEFATIMKEKWENNLVGGILITNPIPEAYSLDSKMMNKFIDEAEEEAIKLGIKGKKITPFLLDKLAQLTANESLKSNIQLVLNNARLGIEIIKAYYER